jgi:hypothetical protein
VLILNGIFLLGFLLGEATLLPLLIFLAAILSLEKLITIYHTHRFIDEYLPVDIKQVLAEIAIPAQPQFLPEQPKQEKGIREVLSVR